jgi:hypothetical protein
MLRIRTCGYLAFALLLPWVFGSRLTEWLMTGQLLVANRIQPSHYITFSGEPVEFVMGSLCMCLWSGLV